MTNTTKHRRISGPTPTERAAASHWIISAGRGLASEPSLLGQAAPTESAFQWRAPVTVDYSATLDNMIAAVGLEAVAAQLASVCLDRAQRLVKTDGVLSRKWGRAATKASELAFLGTLVGGKE